MSLASPAAVTSRPSDTRAAIVATLNTIDGLTGYPVAPDQAVAGAAWPRWIQTTYDGALCSLAKDQYDVFVTLPAGYLETTVDQGDGYRDTAALALVTLGTVQYAEPVQITFDDNQTMPGIRYRLTIR